MESINVFSWSGSATLGGFIIDRYNYQTCFLATAFLQVCSAAILALLLPLIKVEDFRRRATTGGASSRVGVRRGACTRVAGEDPENIDDDSLQKTPARTIEEEQRGIGYEPPSSVLLVVDDDGHHRQQQQQQEAQQRQQETTKKVGSDENGSGGLVDGESGGSFTTRVQRGNSVFT